MIHKGQIGATIRLTSTTDLSNASNFYILYRKPSGLTGFWSATLVNNNSIEYMTLDANDLDEESTWRFQGFIEYADGSNMYSTKVTDRIESVIDVSV